MRRVVVVFIVGLTCTEQVDTSFCDDVKREITQGLVEGFGVDKGVVIAGTCKFFDFEACQAIDLSYQKVCCMCDVYDACLV